jgi:hypothetical protein
MPPESRTVSAYAKQFLGGGTLPFNYASTEWATYGGVSESGWIIEATKNSEAFSFDTYAEVPDASSPVPLQVTVYGPLEGVHSDGGTCSVPASSSGQLTGKATWSAPQTGLYFVVPYHMLGTTEGGTPFVAQAGNSAYDNAYFVMEPVDGG